MREAILYLVKFFDKEEYADQFMQGRLRLNRLGHYRRLDRTLPGFERNRLVLFAFLGWRLATL